MIVIQLKELKNMWVGQQALKAAHEVETYQYVNATALKDLKAKDYQEDLVRARDVLRLKRQAKVEMDRLLLS